MPSVLPRAVAAAVAVSTLAGLSACGAAKSDAAARPAAAPASAPASAAAALSVRDPWVKAADSGMTAAFGTLVNNTATDVTVVSASSPASPMELHEMAMDGGKMVMRPKEGGFLVKAGGTHDLSPGGDHLMLMKPASPIKPGDEVAFTLTLADGGTVSFTAVAKPFAGAGESYAPSTMPSMGS